MAEGTVWTLRQLRERHAATRRLYDELLRVEALSAGIYKLAAGEADQQTPHREDEVYVVLTGRGSVEIEGEQAEISSGSLVYVPKGVQHRFVDIIEDLELLVVFAPPESA